MSSIAFSLVIWLLGSKTHVSRGLPWLLDFLVVSFSCFSLISHSLCPWLCSGAA